MIEGAWSYVWGAYGAAVAALLVLVVAVSLRLRHWARRANEEHRS